MSFFLKCTLKSEHFPHFMSLMTPEAQITCNSNSFQIPVNEKNTKYHSACLDVLIPMLPDQYVVLLGSNQTKKNWTLRNRVLELVYTTKKCFLWFHSGIEDCLSDWL